MIGIVEKVIDNKIYVVFEDLTYRMYINETNVKIVENNQVEIIDGKIVKVFEYNNEIYHKIKNIEQRIKKIN